MANILVLRHVFDYIEQNMGNNHEILNKCTVFNGLLVSFNNWE